MTKDIGKWTFQGKMCDTFDSHIENSIPGYLDVHKLSVDFSKFFITKDSVYLDFGTSTGTLVDDMSKSHPDTVLLNGIDVSKDMINIAKNRYKGKNINFLNVDLLAFDTKCSFITSIFTLQFIPTKSRQDYTDHIYRLLEWGGAAIFFEKTRGCDARFNEILNHLYWDWKYERGHSPSEIFEKSRSIRSVMEPFSTKGNLEMFKRAGFRDIESIWQWGPFKGFLAIK